MENAASALKLAAAILVFIMAIASSFSVFGIAKETADSIITMRDKQAYLEAAELDGILYTTSSSVTSKENTKFTEQGDRIVNIADVFSTIYRYSIESYAITIIKDNKVIARYDVATEGIINNLSSDKKGSYEAKLKENLYNEYTIDTSRDNLIKIDLDEIYVQGVTWLGNTKDIQKRINTDITEGTLYRDSLLEELSEGQIVEVTKEIDESKYLNDSGLDTNLLQQYNMPTVEIIYIVLN